ncbi:MAG: hypothetical protein JW934_19555, partial [Anaerolineae bacterium]|nr:hypothetical protein [Anaerolineae bacterium]
LLADGRHLVLIGVRDGQHNLFALDMESGEERQLSDNRKGFLKSYVYFDGIPYRGLGRASASLDPLRSVVYYIQGREIRAVDMSGHTRTLAEYPAGQMTAFTHVSADGTRLCVPTVDARALDGDNLLDGRPRYDIDRRVQDENLSSYLRVYDTLSGQEVLCEEVPRAWITHVQFSPLDASLILYNHEWPGDCGIRRVWLWDGERHIRLRGEGDGRSRDDWTCHEMWTRDGQFVIYHGGCVGGSMYLGRVRPDGSDRIEIAFPDGWTQYGHFTVGKAGWLVSDGYYRQDDDSPLSSGVPQRNGIWISLQRVDWEEKRIDWVPLCRHGSSWSSQDAHPHPIYDHAGDAVYFTSDRDGRRAVYRVDVREWTGD